MAVYNLLNYFAVRLRVGSFTSRPLRFTSVKPAPTPFPTPAPLLPPTAPMPTAWRSRWSPLPALLPVFKTIRCSQCFFIDLNDWCGKDTVTIKTNITSVSFWISLIQNACEILYQRLEPIRKKNPKGSWEDWVWLDQCRFILKVHFRNIREMQHFNGVNFFLSCVLRSTQRFLRKWVCRPLDSTGEDDTV